MWETPEFWVSTVIGLVGGGFSVLGFMAARRAAGEAQSARVAAQHAASAVKVQTVVVELQEIAYKIARLDQTITYTAARDLLQALKLRRLIAPFAEKPALKKTSGDLLAALTQAKAALAGVAPQPGSETVGPSSPTVYFAIEGAFSDVSGLIGELIGIHETALGPSVAEELAHQPPRQLETKTEKRRD
jgi:hypothetical protein